MPRARRYVSDSAWIVFQAVAQRLVGFITTLMLARLLSLEGFGRYSAVNTTANAFYGLIKLGADFGTHVRLAGQPPESGLAIGTGVSVTLNASLALFIVIATIGGLTSFALAEPIARHLFHAPELTNYLRISAMLLVGLVIAQFGYAAFAGLHAFRLYARIMIGASAVTAIMTVSGALSWGAAGAAWGLAGGQLLGALALLASLRQLMRTGGAALHTRWDGRAWKSLLAIGFPTYLAGLIQIPVDYLLQAQLVRLHGISMLGDLRVIVTATSIVAFIPAALNGPMISAFASSRSDPSNTFSLNLRGIWTVVVASSILIGIMWQIVIPLAFGESFRRAADVGYIALGTAILFALRNVVSNKLLSSGGHRWNLWINGIDASLFWAVSSWLVPDMGLQGYLVGQAVGAGAPLLGLSLFALRRREYRPFLKRTGAASLLTAAVAVFVVTINCGELAPGPQTLIGFLGALAIGALWVRFVFNAEERTRGVRLVSGIALRRPRRS